MFSAARRRFSVPAGASAVDIVRSLPSFYDAMSGLWTPKWFDYLQPLDVTGVYSWADLPYVQSGSPKQCLDVYIAAKPFPRPPSPVCVFVHGGGWFRGDKKHMFHLHANVGVAAARAGCVGVVTNYRLRNEVCVEEQVEDIDACLSWVTSNAKRVNSTSLTFGGDPSKVVLIGSSAGGHLTALWLAKQRRGTHTHIRGFVGVSGVYSVARLGAANPTARVQLVEPVFGADEELWAKNCPLSFSSSSLLIDVPCLLLNAQHDFHLHQDTAELAEKLARQREREGVSVALEQRVIPHANHFTIVGSIGQPGDVTTQAIMAFVRACCGWEPPGQ